MEGIRMIRIKLRTNLYEIYGRKENANGIFESVSGSRNINAAKLRKVFGWIEDNKWRELLTELDTVGVAKFIYSHGPIYYIRISYKGTEDSLL